MATVYRQLKKEKSQKPPHYVIRVLQWQILREGTESPLTHQTYKYLYFLSDTKILPKTGWHVTIQLQVYKINLF